ncbi:MAG TPA: type VI secretion system tube protein Hcp [Patescibacteria group bacterium]|nr:type VI secretion system tube protein Hcp [Patescibacteria group bacterium]
MAVNAYLIIEGVPGQSTSRQNAIDIFSFGFGASMPVDVQHAEAQITAGRASFSAVTISKSVDKTSPLLFQHCTSGDFLKKVEIVFDKAMGDKQEDYFKIQMEDALITNISLGGGGENLQESLSFAFKKIKVSYNPEKDGKLQGFIEKGFDVQTLKAW